MRKLALGALSILPLMAGPATAQNVGVASCDKFLTTFNTCITSKAQGDQKAALLTAHARVKENWTAVAKTAEGKASLDNVCKQTADQMKQQLAALNCSW